MQGLKQLLTVFAHVLFENSAARQHNVITLAIELDDLELHGLAFERRRVLDRTGIDQRTRQEGANAVDHNGETTLDLASDGTGHQRAVVQSGFQRVPCSDTFCAVTRQTGFTETVFERFNGNLDEIANDNFQFALIVQEFVYGDIAFGLESGVDDHKVLVNAHHFSSDDFTCAHILAGKAFFK